MHSRSSYALHGPEQLKNGAALVPVPVPGGPLALVEPGEDGRLTALRREFFVSDYSILGAYPDISPSFHNT